MRSEQIRHRMWLGAAGIFVLSLLVAVADRSGKLSPIRPAIHDALSPGRLMVLALSSRSQPTVRKTGSDPAETGQDQSLAKSERLLRQLMIENARLRRDLKQERASSAAMANVETLSTLAQYDLMRATVVSSHGMPQLLRDLIVDAGKSAGITRSELVIDGNGALLAAGSDDGAGAGDRVLNGAIVVGRIEKTARWVSLVQPVTAAGFRAQVMLLRQTPEGFHFGTVAMLEGTGESECILTGIAHTEAVAVGDEVVTADVNGIRGPQLYFGRVVRAEFLAGGQWDVRVQPAASPDELETVGILRLNLTKRDIVSTDATPRTTAGSRQP